MQQERKAERTACPETGRPVSGPPCDFGHVPGGVLSPLPPTPFFTTCTTFYLLLPQRVSSAGAQAARPSLCSLPAESGERGPLCTHEAQVTQLREQVSGQPHSRPRGLREPSPGGGLQVLITHSEFCTM